MLPIMSESLSRVEIEVDGGAVPTDVLGERNAGRPGLVVIPSIFGPAPDLLRRLSEFGDRALVTVPDPFWRVGGGVVAYSDHSAAVGRMAGFDVGACTSDLRAVVDWTRAHGNGRVVGVGICFGGPFVLRFAGDGALDGVVTWHGSRMQNFLRRARETSCPLRFHFGSDDPVTPPDAIEAVRQAFSEHADCSIVVHPGVVHGFSHDGAAYDEKACRAGLDAVGELLARVS